MLEEYYYVLGLKPNASKKQIREAYRRLSKEYHPDMHSTNKKYYEEKFKKINEAYHVLINVSNYRDNNFNRQSYNYAGNKNNVWESNNKKETAKSINYPSYFSWFPFYFFLLIAFAILYQVNSEMSIYLFPIGFYIIIPYLHFHVAKPLYDLNLDIKEHNRIILRMHYIYILALFFFTGTASLIGSPYITFQSNSDATTALVLILGPTYLYFFYLIVSIIVLKLKPNLPKESYYSEVIKKMILTVMVLTIILIVLVILLRIFSDKSSSNKK